MPFTNGGEKNELFGGDDTKVRDDHVSDMITRSLDCALILGHNTKTHIP